MPGAFLLIRFPASHQPRQHTTLTTVVVPIPQPSHLGSAKNSFLPLSKSSFSLVQWLISFVMLSAGEVQWPGCTAGSRQAMGQKTQIPVALVQQILERGGSFAHARCCHAMNLRHRHSSPRRISILGTPLRARCIHGTAPRGKAM